MTVHVSNMRDEFPGRAFLRSSLANRGPRGERAVHMEARVPSSQDPVTKVETHGVGYPVMNEDGEIREIKESGEELKMERKNGS